MVFEAHGMSFPCTELLLFNYAKINTVFHSMAPLNIKTQSYILQKSRIFTQDKSRLSVVSQLVSQCSI